MSDCIFCDIVNGTTDATFVYRDERACAFMDVQPVNPGHVLITPNNHVAFLSELDEDVGMHMFRIGHQMANALHKSELQCEGVNMFLADGETAMQEVLHVHLHVFPRFEGDGFGLEFGPHYAKRPERAALEDAAEKIRKVL